MHIFKACEKEAFHDFAVLNSTMETYKYESPRELASILFSLRVLIR